MHIIFTPLSIPLLHRFTGKYGRSPRVLLSRSLGSPPWRWSRTLAGGRCRCQSALACLGEAPSGCWRLGFLGGGRSGVCGGVLYVLACSWLWALECVISSLWCEGVMRPPPLHIVVLLCTDHPGHRNCKTSFSELVFNIC